MRSFGDIIYGVQYVERPGAYAFIRNERGEFAVVRTSNGHFLPGGGLDPGEELEAGLQRELKEEIAFQVHKARFVVQAAQYHWSEFYKSYFKKIGHFYEVEGFRAPDARNGIGHDLLWLMPEEAERILSQEFQRWALSEYWRGNL